MNCGACDEKKAIIRRVANGEKLCSECFSEQFENEIWEFIQRTEMFPNSSKICVAVSGGKDSSVMAWILYKLNRVYKPDWKLSLISIDEGIAGYRDPSIECVGKMAAMLQTTPLIMSFKDLFGTTTDDAASVQKRQTQRDKSTCSTCGALRRRALELATRRAGGEHMAMGHNADDCAETVLMNFFRGDVPKLLRSGEPTTGTVPKRCRPLMRCFQKEIVLYAIHNKLPFFSTECPHAPHAFRGDIRNFIAEAQLDNPACIYDILDSAVSFSDNGKPTSLKTLQACQQCGEFSFSEVCQVCTMLASLKL